MRLNCVVVILFSAVLSATGCHKRTPVAAVPSVSAPSIPVWSMPPPPLLPALEPLPHIPPLPPVPSPLEEANRQFASGRYDEAARAYENYLRTTQSGEQRDEALFHLGLIYVLRPAPTADWKRASATLTKLVEEYPGSPFTAPANVIVSVRKELLKSGARVTQRDQTIKQLTTELDRLKKIDAERRKSW